MSDNSAIEWTTSTWNPTVGCAKVSPGCDDCYAIRTAARFQASPAYAGTVHRGQSGLDWTGTVNSLADRLDAPLHWVKSRRIFVDSMSDLFHGDVTDEFIAQVFAVMALTPQHTYQLLTKRHGRMRSLLSAPSFPQQVTRALLTEPRFARGSWPVPSGGVPWPLPNVWLGVSVEDQKRADLRIPALLDTPAAVRWISAEPLLGPVNLEFIHYFESDCGGCSGLVSPAHEPACGTEPGPHWGLDWVVCGGESGPGARPMHPAWAQSLRDECADAKVPFFFKQWGNWAPAPWHGEGGATHAFTASMDDTGMRHFLRLSHGPTSGERDLTTPAGAQGMRQVGKKAAGRLLDGRTWDDYPAVHTAQPAVTG